MAAAKKKQDDKNLAILRELITHNGNKNCFDCLQRGPTYVNMTIGSFICSKCSGMLRGLTPPHRVKSISMATFTPEEIDQIKKQGNDYCKSIWLGLHEGNPPVLKDEQSIRDYMSEKYEKKRFYLDPSFARKQNVTVEKPVIVPNTSSKDNGIWNSSSIKQSVVKPPMSSAQIQPTFNSNNSFQFTPVPVATSSQPTLACPKFPVNFATADIFNSSQMNNNMSNSTQQNPMNSFDKKNANTVTHDRYAALADLDFALRQQYQSQAQGEIKSTTANPFEMASMSEVSKNPFCSNTLVNGNAHYSNPFSMGFGVAQSGQSKNPFL